MTTEGSTQRRARSSQIGPCVVEGCERQKEKAGYCGAHYQRVRKNGDPGPAEIERHTAECSVGECPRRRYSRGLCRAHYERWRRHGDPGTDEVRPKAEKGFVGRCEVDGCERPRRKRGWCMKHYERWVSHGDPAWEPRKQGWKRITHSGYVEVRYGSGAWSEHRLVWESAHGPLLPGQNIHHRNGDRADNRLSNLEIWDTMQPAGQRPEDKVEYALTMLKRYAPQLLA